MSSLNERKLTFLKANGATSDNLNDAAYEYLVAQGQARRNVNDMWFSHLRGFALTGTVEDMQQKFWAAAL